MNFLQGLQILCAKHDLLFLMDEVQAGIARTGEFLGYQKSGAQPHAVAMAKGLGGGFPIGAIWVNEQHAETLYPGQSWHDLWRFSTCLYRGTCRARCDRG